MSKAKNNGALRLYKSYSFRDKDPVIDVMRTIVERSGSTYTDVHNSSGVSEATLRNWFHGTTRRPQFATVNAVARALGHEFRAVKR